MLKTQYIVLLLYIFFDFEEHMFTIAQFQQVRNAGRAQLGLGAQVISQASVKVAGGTLGISRLQGGRICFQIHVVGARIKFLMTVRVRASFPLVYCHMDYSNTAACFMKMCKLRR